MQFPCVPFTHRWKSWRAWCGARQEWYDAWLSVTICDYQCSVTGRICARTQSNLLPLPRDLCRGQLFHASSCSVCSATGGCWSPEMSAHVKQLSATLNSLMALICSKCFSPFRVSALCQWDETSPLLSLKCGNLSPQLLDKLYLGCSKCSLISPADCLLPVVYLTW